MNLKKSIQDIINSTKTGSSLLNDRDYRTVFFAVWNLILNILYAFYNGILGILTHSVIFVASCIYYLLLTGMRFFGVLLKRKKNIENEYKASVVIGILLSVLSIVFSCGIFP